MNHSTRLPVPFTADIIRARMLSIEQLAEPVMKLSASGLLIRYGTIWYVDTIYNSPVVDNTVISLNSPPSLSLERQLVKLDRAMLRVKGNSSRALADILLRLIKLEAAIAAIPQ